MKRVSVSLPDGLYELLKEQSEVEKTSISEICYRYIDRSFREKSNNGSCCVT